MNRDLPPWRKPKFQAGQLVEHVSTGNIYMIVHIPEKFDLLRDSATGQPVYEYQGISGGRWIRVQSEMEDGRFILSDIKETP